MTDGHMPDNEESNDFSVDLGLVGTDDLIAEIRKRTPAGICVVAFEDEEGEKFQGRSWGSIFWRAGTATSIAKQFGKMASDLMEGGTKDE